MTPCDRYSIIADNAILMFSFIFSILVLKTLFTLRFGIGIYIFTSIIFSLCLRVFFYTFSRSYRLNQLLSFSRYVGPKSVVRVDSFEMVPKLTLFRDLDKAHWYTASSIDTVTAPVASQSLSVSGRISDCTYATYYWYCPNKNWLKCCK